MPEPIRVTPDNFCRAETDRYFGELVRQGGLGKFTHAREPTPLDKQTVVRMNRDTLYSSAVFDLDAGSAVILLPNGGTRFISLEVWDEEEYCPLVAYGAGRHTLSRENIGTRYAGAAVRIFINASSPDDVREVHRLQDAIKVEQTAPGKLEMPNWDKASQDKVREALSLLGETMPDFRRTFGSRNEVDPVRHLIGAATGWGGNPEKDVLYVNLTPTANDGKRSYRVRVPGDVPVDGFWSISVYNKQGYFEKNAKNAYSVNNVTARKNADGSVDVQFGGGDGKATNYLPITRGWNAVVRLYRPHEAIVSGGWTFPELQPVQ
jgi:hypothetical protein